MFKNVTLASRTWERSESLRTTTADCGKGTESNGIGDYSPASIPLPEAAGVRDRGHVRAPTFLRP